MAFTELDVLREDARELVEEHPNSLTWRSCWECNSAHEYLKGAEDIVILCIWCGKYFFKGTDITTYEEKND